MQKIIGRALPFVVTVAVIWGAYVALFGRNLFDLTDQDLKPLKGCYEVSGRRIFRIADRMISAEGLKLNFKAVHEKGVDNLILEDGVGVRRPEDHPRLVLGGTIDKVTIIYDRPIRMRLYSEGSIPVEASKVDC